MIPNVFYIAIAYDGRIFFNATDPDVDYEKVLDDARDNADKYDYEFTVYEVNISEQTIKEV